MVGESRSTPAYGGGAERCGRWTVGWRRSESRRLAAGGTVKNATIDKHIEQAALGQEAVAALDTMAPILDEQEASIVARALKMVTDGEMSSDQAMVAWMELAAIRDTRKQLMGRIRAGNHAARAVKAEMDRRADSEKRELHPHT